MSFHTKSPDDISPKWDRVCVPCANGRCYRCLGEVSDGSPCGCSCKGKQVTLDELEARVKEAFDWAYTSGVDAETHPKYLRQFEKAVRTHERARLRAALDAMRHEDGSLEDMAWLALQALDALQGEK